jgi:hypothetical protein
MGLTMVVLAAGMGSRFGGPKQLVPIGPSGECILDYNAHDAARAGFDRLVVITRPELDAEVREVVAQGVGRLVDTRIVLQRIPAGRTKPLGTADAVATAAAEVDGPFGVANADDLYGAGSFLALREQLAAHGDQGANVGFRLGDTVPLEGSVSRALVQTSDDGFVTEVTEVHGIHRTPDGWDPPQLTDDTLVSMNLWGFPLETMAAMAEARDRFVATAAEGEVFLPTEANGLIASGRLRVALLSTTESWAGLTNPDDIVGVRAFVAARGDSPLWS